MARRKNADVIDISDVVDDVETLEPPFAPAPTPDRQVSGKAIIKQLLGIIENNPECVKMLSAQIDGTPTRAELDAAGWHDTTPRDQGVTIIRIIHRR